MLRGCHFWNAWLLALVLAVAAGAQQSDPQAPPRNSPPPRSDTDAASQQPEPQESPTAPEAEPNRRPRSTSPVPANESSSRSNIMDISPPLGDAQEHPDSEVPQELVGTNEMHPWNPHKADKNVEVGDYYFKEKNYRAAESRYREALYYKENDAIATFRLAQALDKLARPGEACEYYQAYLKILPHGPNSGEARKALERLSAQSKNQTKDSSQPQR